MELMKIIARHIKETEFEMLPAPVRQNGKLFFIDLIGVALAGSSAPGCNGVVEQLRAWQGKEESTVIAHGCKLPSIHAALANSMFAHSWEYDDTHIRARAHTTDPVIPPALAVAEAVGSVSGKKFITAIVLGVDLIGRLGLALRGNIHSGWLPASVCGVFGAAAAVAKILELSTDEIRDALGISYSLASGNRQALLDGAITKRMQPAFAGMQGIYGAFFAKRGISGIENVINGKFGLAALYANGRINEEEIIKDLGKRFEITNLSFRVYPCCAHTHPSIQAALRIVNRENIEPSEIKEVEVAVPPAAYDLVGSPFQIRKNPQVDAQFSIPYTVATAIANKSLGLKDFQAPAVRGNAAIHDLAARIKVFADPNLTVEDQNSPLAVVRIICKSGEEYLEKVRVVKGYPEDPVTEDECVKKFRECALFAHESFSQNKTEALIKILLDVERIQDMKQVGEYLL